MRIAIVVFPAAATAAAAALLALQLRPRAPVPAPRVAVVPVPVAVVSPPSHPRPHLKYEHPVGGQYLEADLLITGQHAPLLLERRDDELDAVRYAWRYEALARAMASELAAVIDDACPTGCDHAAAARTALATWLDGTARETHALRGWTRDEGVTLYERQLTVHAATGPIVVDVTCRSESYTYGMRGWNDETTCDAVLRDRGRTLATYRPRQLAVYEHHAVLAATDAYEQRVSFADGAELLTETGWNYEGDPDLPDLVKTEVRRGPSWIR